MFDLVPAHTALRAPLCFEDKATDGRVYLRAPHTVIQLVEVAAPPPRRISSVVDASAASSSYSSSSSSSSFDEEEEMEEEESVCSSYCSSDDYLPEDQPTPATHPDTSDAFARKMKRILLWRAHSEAPAPGTSFHQFSSVALLIPLSRRRLAEAQARRDRRARPGRRYCASPPLPSIVSHR